MTENGFNIRTFVKERVARYGQTVLCMKAGGRTIKPMVREDLSMPTVMSMTVNGKMTKRTVTVSIVI